MTKRSERVKVVAVVRGYHQAIVRAEDGRQYAITRRTSGVNPTDLTEGQTLVCEVLENTIVVEAKVIEGP